MKNKTAKHIFLGAIAALITACGTVRPTMATANADQDKADSVNLRTLMHLASIGGRSHALATNRYNEVMGNVNIEDMIYDAIDRLKRDHNITNDAQFRNDLLAAQDKFDYNKNNPGKEMGYSSFEQDVLQVEQEIKAAQQTAYFGDFYLPDLAAGAGESKVAAQYMLNNAPGMPTDSTTYKQWLRVYKATFNDAAQSVVNNTVAPVPHNPANTDASDDEMMMTIEQRIEKLNTDWDNGITIFAPGQQRAVYDADGNLVGYYIEPENTK